MSDDTTSTIFWYAFAVAHRSELGVLRKLTASGYLAFVPTELARKRVGRHGHRVASRPAVPGYVFVGFHKSQRVPWRRLRDMTGIRGPVMFAGYPARVREGEINAISEYSGSSIVPLPMPELCEGDRVKVTTGAFASFFGEIEALAKKRVKVGIEMFGKCSSVWMPRSILQAA